jgi:hypothetical protein
MQHVQSEDADAISVCKCGSRLYERCYTMYGQQQQCMARSLRVACCMSPQVYSYFEADMQPQLRTTLADLSRLLGAAQDTPQQQQQQQQQEVVLLDTRSAAQYTAQVGCSGCTLEDGNDT